MYVIKRGGKREIISFDKILTRLKRLGQEADIKINYSSLVIKVIDQLYSGITTTRIDELSAEQCASMSSLHPDYNKLAGRIVISNHHKNTKKNFTAVVRKLYKHKDGNAKYPLVSKELYEEVEKNSEIYESMIDSERDYLIDYFGFKTLERAYLIRINDVIVERPQHMWLRVSIGIHGTNIEKIRETYDLMSKKYFTHATPTLFNAGTLCPQLSSCYLAAMEEDSIEGIYNTLKDCALISKWSGGIGLHIHNIRGNGSYIRGTNGKSNGIVPMLKVFNNTAKYVDQGGGKRKGSIAVYLEPWHLDIELFLQMKKNHGDEELKARDLFYAVWMPDLLMKRIKSNEKWTLMCPDKCKGLSEVYGEEFEQLYERYENEGKGERTVNARELWFQILDAQMETGTPYIVYKDAANRKSNQKNLGVIKSSNLCAEIIEYSDKNETAVCNLASIALPLYINETESGEIYYDYEMLHKVTKTVAYNLNRIIDVNYYPTEKTKRSNLRHRPIGIGVQGLADVFMQMNLPFTHEKSKEINKKIFETIYHAALEQSCEIAKERSLEISKGNVELLNEYECKNKKSIYKGAYSSFEGSPASQGILQFDMWNAEPSERYNWNELKDKIKQYGLRNSLLLAPMPTASTSQILGYNECIEPITSNIYNRRTLAGEFILTNKYLMEDLMKKDLWNENIKNNIISNNGSIQHIEEIPKEIREKYKTVWEIQMKDIIDMAADRGQYICQSQSLNLWLENPTYGNLTSMHFYSWSKGLKTGIYYLRRRARYQAQQFTIEPKQIKSNENENEETICEMCSA